MEAIRNLYRQYGGMSRSAYVIFFARTVTAMGGFIWPMLTLILSRKIGYTATEIAMVSVGVGVLFIPAKIIGGKLADRFNRKWLIIALDIVSVSFFFACARVEPGHLMTAFFVMAGLFANMEGPAFESLVADISLPSEREKIYSLTYLGNNLGVVFGASIGGLLFANHLSLAFMLDGMTTLMSTALIFFFVSAEKREAIVEEERNIYEEEADHTVHGLRILWQRKPLVIQLAVFALAILVYDQWTFVIPLYLDNLFGEGGARLFGFLTGFNGLVVIFFTPVLTALMRPMRDMVRAVVGVVLFSASFLFFARTQIFWVMIIIMGFFTLGEIAKVLGTSPYLSRRVPASHRGRINSYLQVACFVGGLAGRVLMGILMDRFSYPAAFTVLGIIGLLTAVLAIINIPMDRRTFPVLYQGHSGTSTERLA